MGRDFLRAREKEEQAAKMQALAANDIEAYRRLLQSKGSSQAGNADTKSRELFTFPLWPWSIEGGDSPARPDPEPALAAPSLRPAGP